MGMCVDRVVVVLLWPGLAAIVPRV
jgi:hypothetical protein